MEQKTEQKVKQKEWKPGIKALKFSMSEDKSYIKDADGRIYRVYLRNEGGSGNVFRPE